LDNNNFVVVGDKGTIVKGNINKNSIKTKNSYTNEDLNSVAFVNSNIGFCVGDNGVVLKTKDGGDNWFREPNINTTVKLYDIKFGNGKVGMITGEDVLLITDDYGETWSIKESQTAKRISIGRDGSIGGVFGDKLLYYDYAWGQEEFKRFRYGSTLINVCDIAVIHDDLEFFVGGFGYHNIIRKYLNQSTWEIESKDAKTNFMLKAVNFIYENNGIVVGHNGVIRTTINSGDDWKSKLTK